MSAKERKSSTAAMEGDTSMGGDRRGGADSKPSNPFKMPSDEEIFSLRDDERNRKEEERKRFLTLPVHEKTTWSSRAGSTSKNVLKEDDEEAVNDVDSKRKNKFGGVGAVADNMYKQERHREKENMTDFIEKKRQMFLVQMSLDTKRAEIRKLEEQAQQREEALRKSEQMLEEDASRFELFLKMNDQKAVDAIRKAEAETKNKQDKVQEIKKLNSQVTPLIFSPGVKDLGLRDSRGTTASWGHPQSSSNNKKPIIHLRFSLNALQSPQGFPARWLRWCR